MYLVHPCDTALRSHECLALRPIVGEIERKPAKRNAETAYTAGRTGLLPNDGRSHHPYRQDECNSELCRARIRSTYGSPLLIALMKLAALASQNRTFIFNVILTAGLP
jgi:hypothetical protein